MEKSFEYNQMDNPQNIRYIKRRKKFGFKAKTPLDVGLKKIIDWYTSNKVDL